MINQMNKYIVELHRCVSLKPTFSAAPDLLGNQHQPSAPAGGPGSGEASGPADHPPRGQPSGQPGSVALLRHLPPPPLQPAEDQRPGGEHINAFLLSDTNMNIKRVVYDI